MSEPNTTAADWAKAEFTLELGADLLPIVPAGTEPSPYSKVKKFGKTPSDFGPHGARGIAGWQSMEITPSDLQRWAAEPRYSMCVRASAVRAIDVDVTDPALANQIDELICGVTGLMMPKRVRSNSSKFLVPFRLKAPLPKRIIRCANKQIIEFLADGQQWLICGAHESGVRYQWLGSDSFQRLPDDIPELQLDQFEALWLALSTKFAVSTDPTDVTVRKDATDAPERPGEVLTAIPDEVTYNKLRDALAWPALREAADENSIWAEIGYALLSIPEGNRLWLAFERGGGPHENRPQDWWNAHRTQTPRSDWRHIFTLARKYGWGREPPPATAFPIVATSEQDKLIDAQPDKLVDLLAPAPEKPLIRLQVGDLDNIATQCEAIIDAYSQGEFMVRFGHTADDGFKRDPHARPLVRATPEWLRRELSALATFTKFDGRSLNWVPADCPKDLAQMIASQRHWKNIRPLSAVVRAPFMREDGSICSEVGYDKASHVMYIRSIDFPAIPEKPTREDALYALSVLLAPFDQFPMANEASKSVFAAHLLTEVARTAIPTAPMFWYSATTAGTGKTLLSEMASLIAYGTAPAAKPWVDGEEMRKALFSALLAGDRAIRFDNLSNGFKFRSPGLCIFLTAPIYSDRKLGVSEAPTVPNRAVVIATGNNVTPAGDLARRSLVIRMDANMPSNRLRQREFKIDDIHGYVLEHRAELLAAALTVLRAYQRRDGSRMRKLSVPMQSFVEWSRLVRDALIWLDMVDPLTSQEDETDDEASDTLGALFAKLFAVTEGKPFYAMSLIGGDTELTQALVAVGCDSNDAKKIGMWLAAKRGVIAGDYKLVDLKKTLRGRPWQLVPQSGAFGDLL